MSVTIKDIAKIAGVSHSTVSRSLNNSPRVAEETKNKIKQIAQELGFEFNANARSLSTARTNTIGIIYDSSFHDSHIHFFTTSIQNLIRNSLEKKDLDALITFKDNSFTGENNIIRLINKKKIDGLIIMGTQIDLKTIEYIKKSNIPFVFSEHIAENNLSVDAVYCDHFLGGYIAAEHLIKLGHKKILCVQRTDKAQRFLLRTKGFTSALKDYNIKYSKNNFNYASYSLEGGYKYAEQNIEHIKNFTAIFVHTDAQALGIIEQLKEKRIKIPNDISIVGYDDIELGRFYKPYLTTIHQPIEKIALLTCERLINMLESKKTNKTKQTFIPPKLIVRNSTSAPL